MEYQH